jgi:hypothetical protein
MAFFPARRPTVSCLMVHGHGHTCGPTGWRGASSAAEPTAAPLAKGAARPHLDGFHGR